MIQVVLLSLIVAALLTYLLLLLLSYILKKLFAVVLYPFRTPFSFYQKDHTHFTKMPHQARLDFLNNIFGITQADCHAFRFDGDAFWLRSQVHYKDIDSIECTSDEEVRVSNHSLPHVASWKYTRVDGGPDLRYRNNNQTLTSKRYSIAFRGRTNGKLFIYDKPYGSLSSLRDVIERFNRMLIIKEAIDFDEYYPEYLHKVEQVRELERWSLAAQAKKEEASKVADAYSKLSPDLQYRNPSLIAKDKAAQLERDGLQQALSETESRIKRGSREIEAVVDRIKAEILNFESVKLIGNYEPKYR